MKTDVIGLSDLIDVAISAISLCRSRLFHEQATNKIPEINSEKVSIYSKATSKGSAKRLFGLFFFQTLHEKEEMFTQRGAPVPGVPQVCQCPMHREVPWACSWMVTLLTHTSLVQSPKDDVTRVAGFDTQRVEMLHRRLGFRPWREEMLTMCPQIMTCLTRQNNQCTFPFAIEIRCEKLISSSHGFSCLSVVGDSCVGALLLISWLDAFAQFHDNSTHVEGGTQQRINYTVGDVHPLNDIIWNWRSHHSPLVLHQSHLEWINYTVMDVHNLEL